MKLCIPVEEVRGIYSRVSPHFGAAEAYLLIDTESLAIDSFEKEVGGHEHGRCGPVRLLRGRDVEGVCVSGIGRNAIGRLQEMGVAVFKTDAATVAEALLQLRENALEKMTVEEACGQHHGHGRNLRGKHDA